MWRTSMPAEAHCRKCKARTACETAWTWLADFAPRIGLWCSSCRLLAQLVPPSRFTEELLALTPPWQCLDPEALMPTSECNWKKPPIDDDAVFPFGRNEKCEKRWPEIGRPEPREYA